MMVIEALERLGENLGIRLIVPRHEAAAAHVCDAHTRVTGGLAAVGPVANVNPPGNWLWTAARTGKLEK